MSILSASVGLSQNLLTNGDFENGAAGWSGNAVNVVTENNNSYNAANVTVAGNPWDVNLSYVIPMTTAGTNYKLTFTAWSDTNRPLIAGIGLNQDPWTNVTQTVSLTNTAQTFILNFTSTFANANSRVIFDMGNAVGFVGIDNVMLEIVPATDPNFELVLGFEADEIGGIDGGPFGNGVAPTIVAGTGSNTSQVMRMQGNPSGEIWQGINLNLSQNVELTSIKTMSIDVMSETPITFLVKVLGGLNGAPVAAAAVSHNGDGTWQTIPFSFLTSLDGQAATANGTYSKFVIHTYWSPSATTFGQVTADQRVFFVDNLRGPLGAPAPEPGEPAVAAPTPPNRPAADVKSIFSDAYAPIAVLNYQGIDNDPANDNTFNASWSPATTTLVQIEGNNTNRVTGLGFVGMAFLAGRFDATDFTHFHIDMWTDTPTLDKSFNLKIVNFNGGNAEANAIEFSITNANFLTQPNTGNWYSFDIPLGSFTPINGNARNDIAQFVITSDLGTVFYDNVYFHKGTTLSNDSFTTNDVKIYPNPATTELFIGFNGVIDYVRVYNLQGQQVLNANNMNSVDVSSLTPGMYMVTVGSQNQQITKKFIKK